MLVRDRMTADPITVAPEAGSPRLRRSLKKNISDDDILNLVERTAELEQANESLQAEILLVST